MNTHASAGSRLHIRVDRNTVHKRCEDSDIARAQGERDRGREGERERERESEKDRIEPRVHTEESHRDRGSEVKL